MFEISETRNTTLTFNDASHEYDGQYYCIVSKNGLQAESKIAVYRYGGNTSDIFVVEPSFPTFIQSSNQTLTCQTDSSSLEDPPDIHWYYTPDNRTKYNIENNEWVPYNLGFFNIFSERYKSVLELVYASADYNGEYYCVAAFGEERQSFSKSGRFLYLYYLKVNQHIV